MNPHHHSEAGMDASSIWSLIPCNVSFPLLPESEGSDFGSLQDISLSPCLSLRLTSFRLSNVSVQLTLWDSTCFQPAGTAQNVKVRWNYITYVIGCIWKPPKILVERVKNDQNLNLMVHFWNKLCSISLLLRNYGSERCCLLVLSTISGRRILAITSN
jgi:hypothetical protein